MDGTARNESTQEWLKDDEGSYLTSVSDLMSALVFVFILVLIVFAIQFTQAAVRQEQAALEHQQVAEQQSEIIRGLTNSDEIRRTLLQEIESALQDHGVSVQVDMEHGILRLPESILFPSASARLRPEGEKALQVLASTLRQILPCFTNLVMETENCRPDTLGKLETIFIEGHTDSLPISTPEFPDNWTLSTARAIQTFYTLILTEPELEDLRNLQARPIFTVSGYADRRPVADNETEQARQFNRRIDLRFIMVSPGVPEIIDLVDPSFE